MIYKMKMIKKKKFWKNRTQFKFIFITLKSRHYSDKQQIKNSVPEKCLCKAFLTILVVFNSFTDRAVLCFIHFNWPFLLHLNHDKLELHSVIFGFFFSSALSRCQIPIFFSAPYHVCVCVSIYCI